MLGGGSGKIKRERSEEPHEEPHDRGASPHVDERLKGMTRLYLPRSLSSRPFVPLICRTVRSPRDAAGE